jgi:hypothetical protein
VNEQQQPQPQAQPAQPQQQVDSPSVKIQSPSNQAAQRQRIGMPIVHIAFKPCLEDPRGVVISKPISLDEDTKSH